jgi:hypothetical protein
MILDELKHIDSSKKEIRKFSRVVGIAFIVLGILLWIFSGRIHQLPFTIGAVLILIGLVLPIVLLPLHKLWMGLSIVLSFISTRVILTIIYYLILTPIAVAGRLFGKDFIDEKIDRTKKSYWIKKDIQELNNENIKRQF